MKVRTRTVLPKIDYTRLVDASREFRSALTTVIGLPADDVTPTFQGIAKLALAAAGDLQVHIEGCVAVNEEGDQDGTIG